MRTIRPIVTDLIGGIVVLLIGLAFSLYVPRIPGLMLAFGPAAGVALAAGAGALMKAIGGQPNFYRPSKGTLRGYENRESGDINRLYGPNPYSGNDLGFD